VNHNGCKHHNNSYFGAFMSLESKLKQARCPNRDPLDLVQWGEINDPRFAEARVQPEKPLANMPYSSRNTASAVPVAQDLSPRSAVYG
jgi:hypothetical protein